jgi:hypothetical protein
MKRSTYKRPRSQRQNQAPRDEYSLYPLLTAAKRLVLAHAIQESVRVTKMTDRHLALIVARFRAPAFVMYGDT